jgi:hypothetical protein
MNIKQLLIQYSIAIIIGISMAFLVFFSTMQFGLSGMIISLIIGGLVVSTWITWLIIISFRQMRKENENI